MDFKLGEGAAFPEEIRRIVLEQIDLALDNLKPGVVDKDEAIHDVRVSIKKIRAVLRLVQDSLGEAIFKTEDTAFRDTARMLSKVRDSAAMLEVVDKLIEHFPDQVDAIENVRAQLVDARNVQHEDRDAMTKAAESLNQARQRVMTWPWSDPHESFAKGLKRVYKRGRTRFAVAYDEPSVESFHEWRKQVKHLLYETRLLSPVWPKPMEALAATLKTLGKCLSEDHDLAILGKWITENDAGIEDLVPLIDRRRNELQLTAKPLGTKLYTEKPRAFADRIEDYWKAWRSEVEKTQIVEIS